MNKYQNDSMNNNNPSAFSKTNSSAFNQLIMVILRLIRKRILKRNILLNIFIKHIDRFSCVACNILDQKVLKETKNFFLVLLIYLMGSKQR